MKNKSIHSGPVFLGKFQPPHIGHVITISKLLDAYPNLAIGITNGLPSRYSFELRSEVFQAVFPGIKCIEISGEIEKATDNLDQKFEKDTIFLSGNPSVLEQLRHRGYIAEYTNRSVDDVYSGTAIRNVMDVFGSPEAVEICEFKIEKLDFLKPIEKVFPNHFENLEGKILEDGIMKQPIIICRDTGAVLDGSHRYAFLLKHGFCEAPVMAVNYSDESIFVGNRICHRFKYTNDKWLSKSKVLQVAYSGELLNPRTTRHFFSVPKSAWPIELDQLKREDSRDIEHLLYNANRQEQIEHNKAYLEEVHEEYEALISYLAEQVKVREYLREQIAKLETDK